MNFILDGNNLLYRSFHVLDYGKRGGVSTGLLASTWLGNLRYTLKKLTDGPAGGHHRLFIAWDVEGSSAPRKLLWPAYKVGRPHIQTIRETREVLLRTLADLSPRFSLTLEDGEADDIISLMCTDGNDWTVLSGDKDNYSSLSDRVSVYDLSKKKLVTLQSFVQEFGFDPINLPRYKAIIGDKSDKWPGLRGVGPKTLAKWVTVHGWEKLSDAMTPGQLVAYNVGLSICQTPLQTADIGTWGCRLAAQISLPDKLDHTSLCEAFSLHTSYTLFLRGL